MRLGIVGAEPCQRGTLGALAVTAGWRVQVGQPRLVGARRLRTWSRQVARAEQVVTMASRLDVKRVGIGAPWTSQTLQPLPGSEAWGERWRSQSAGLPSAAVWHHRRVASASPVVPYRSSVSWSL